MSWNIANAKQQFSELVRLSVQEPQVIYKHNKPVACMVNSETFAAFTRWQTSQQTHSLIDEFAVLRGHLAVLGLDGIAPPVRSDRPNALVTMLDEESQAQTKAQA